MGNGNRECNGLPEEGDEKEGGMGLFSSDGVIRKR